MGGAITYDSNRSDWFTSSPVIDLWSNIRSQVIELIGYVGYPFKIISRADNNIIEQAIEISSFTMAPYELDGHKVKSFPIAIECLPDGEYTAALEEAGIIVANKKVEGAVQCLKEVIVELYDIFKNEPSLGPEPQRQLSVLERYIV